MLRYRTDRRTLLYLAFTTALTLVNWKTGKVHPVLYPVTLFMFFTTAVISHNHNHLGMWRSPAPHPLPHYRIPLLHRPPAPARGPAPHPNHPKPKHQPGGDLAPPQERQGDHPAALL